MADESPLLRRSDGREPDLPRTPLRIASIYLFLGLGWIWGSDLALSGFSTAPELWANIGKGSLFVGISALVLHTLVRREVREVARTYGLLQAVAEGTTDAIFAKDREGRYLFINRAASQLVGVPVEKILGCDDGVMFDAEGARQLRARDLAIMEGGRTETAEEVLTAAGVTRIYLATKAPLRDVSGEVVGVVGISRDITERKRNEELLRLDEERYRRLVEVLPDAVFIWVPDRIVYCNPAFLNLIGAQEPEEVLGKSPFDLTPPEEHALVRSRIQQMLGTGSPSSPRIGKILRLDGGHVPVRLVSAPIQDRGHEAILVHIHDLSDRQQLEAQFQQAQKMEVMGRLAGGVAHDFNNLLTVINGHAELTLEEHGRDPDLREALAAIRDAGERASRLTRQLLAFSRTTPREQRPLELIEFLRGATKMIRRLVPEDIEVRLDLGETPAWMRADPGQVEQVVLNLVVNARDAMPAGGLLVLRARRSPSPPHSIELSVEDTGSGMSEAIQRDIFKPFFTTKPEGRGTGLGLSVVDEIVRVHGGNIEVRSEEGKGSTFTLRFPALEDRSPAPRDEDISAAPRGREVLMVVDDEVAVRLILRTSLESLGYTVIDAVDGEQAAQLAKQLEGSLDLLLTDIVMPRISGPELARGLRASHPTLKVLYISGYPPGESGGSAEVGAPCLAKPFTRWALARKVREVLDSPPESRSDPLHPG